MSDIKATGPLFEGDPKRRIQQGAEDVIRELTEKGMERLTSAFPTGVPVKTGNYRRNIHPTIHGLTAQIDDNGVIYGSWLEGTSSRNETTRFKGYSTFRKTTQWLQDQVEPVAHKHALKIVKELGG